MEEKNPYDDIIIGLAVLLIKYTRSRSRACDDGVSEIHSRENWSMTYGKYTYLLKSHDGEVDSIHIRMSEESEDE